VINDLSLQQGENCRQGKGLSIIAAIGDCRIIFGLNISKNTLSIYGYRFNNDAGKGVTAKTNRAFVNILPLLNSY